MPSNLHQLQNSLYSNGAFQWWTGKVVDVKDPIMNGRIKVEIFGFYDGLSKKDLPWAIPMGLMTSASLKGVGRSPTGVDEGSIVYGFFMDSQDAQVPVYIGTLYGMPGGEGTQDTHKNAREKQSIKKKERLKGKRPKGGEFREPDTEFEAKYPFNHVTQTKNGHIFELDDTEGKQRFHYRHPSVTDFEILKNGTIVLHCEKELWIMTKDRIHIHTDADVFLSTKQNIEINCEGNLDFKIGGNMTGVVQGNYDLKVNGNLTHKIGGSIDSKAGGTEKRKASMIYLN